MVGYIVSVIGIILMVKCMVINYKIIRSKYLYFLFVFVLLLNVAAIVLRYTGYGNVPVMSLFVK